MTFIKIEHELKETLIHHNTKQIQRAGARYTPTLDPDAPNLEVEYVVENIDALSSFDFIKTKIQEYHDDLLENWEDSHSRLIELFKNRIKTPKYLCELIFNEIEEIPNHKRSGFNKIFKTTLYIIGKLYKLRYKYLDEEKDTKISNNKKESIRSIIRDLDRIIDSLESLEEFMSSSTFSLLDRNCMLLTGEWGTGKTHLLCDYVKRNCEYNNTIIFTLAHSLPAISDPMLDLGNLLSVHCSKSQMLKALDDIGKKSNKRSLIIFDGINEGVIAKWKSALSTLIIEIKNYPNIGIILSCRTPFENILFSDKQLKHIITITHPGFLGKEFEAQTEFFSYYDIPQPNIPVLASEFSRPLFLKLFCSSIEDLANRTKKKKLRDYASGQKGLVHIFEYIITKLGKPIEARYELGPKACWNILKGQTKNFGSSASGIAQLMVRNDREYIFRNECLAIISDYSSISDEIRLNDILNTMVDSGLLTIDAIWDESWIEIIRLPYQRFSDHLITRHLLDQYLNKQNINSIYRSFYKNKPLGKIFTLDRGRQKYNKPNLATALMIEFPERVKRVLPKEERELVFYLPKKVRRLSPVIDCFLDGLIWRSNDSYSKQTHRIISILLESSNSFDIYNTYEVLATIASRSNHEISPRKLVKHLSELSMASRDLRWSEYIRHSTDESLIYRLIAWVNSTDEMKIENNVIQNTIMLLQLYLTTTVRNLRDRITYAIYQLGLKNPGILFKISENSLTFNDIYIPERMFAASYGVAMFYASTNMKSIKDSIVNFSKWICVNYFLPSAKYTTTHAILREYAKGIIEISRKMKPYCIANQYIKYTNAPFTHFPSSFPSHDIADQQVDTADSALRIDFENYTIGSLIPNRRNYDSNNIQFKSVLNKIKWRIIKLGYQPSEFSNTDNEISRRINSRSSDNIGKVERYGKKYSRIAYFEMYGEREDRNLLRYYKIGERISDCDIDPSFPKDTSKWNPQLQTIFQSQFTDYNSWLANGPEPDYSHLYQLDCIEQTNGPWILLDGFIEEKAKDDPRETFTHITGILVNKDRVSTLKSRYDRFQSPGYFNLPAPGADLYTFAGEIPWSNRFGNSLRNSNGKAVRDIRRAYDEGGENRNPGINVEVPIYNYAWESHHSILNITPNITFPAPALCELLELQNRGGSFNLYTKNNEKASLYFESDNNNDSLRSNFFYLRKDMLLKYLIHTGQTLILVSWGERSLHYKEFENNRHIIEQARADYKDSYKFFIESQLNC